MNEINSYIEDYHEDKTRYEIDSYLLEQGYSSEEIEQGWQALREKPLRQAQQAILETKLLLRQFGSGLTLLGGFSGCIVSLVTIMHTTIMFSTQFITTWTGLPRGTTSLWPLALMILAVSVQEFCGGEITKWNLWVGALLELIGGFFWLSLASFTGLWFIFCPLGLLQLSAAGLTVFSSPKIPMRPSVAKRI